MIQVQELDLTSPAAFAVVGGLALVDGVVPLVPARTAVIAVGVVAGTGDWRAYPLLAVATLAAFVSDNISYALGARLWPRVAPRLLRGDRSRRTWERFERGLTTRGAVLIALARIIPGGPTPITLMAGSVRFPIRSFRYASALGALLWSAFAFSIGLLGESVTRQPLIALGLGLLLAAIVNFALRAHVRRAAGGSAGGISIEASHRPDEPTTLTRFPGTR